ncbi:hypothetical protein SAMN02910369_00956 [Lachnospiraceae bacterium NE2001]|nr:hypothetical protein SAMN02910369_00956 [Lachnospiraceae bacterium NE2001]
MDLKAFKDRFGRGVEELQQSIQSLGTYDIKKVNELPEQNGIGFVLSHKKTKARFSTVICDDDNKVFAIGFRTPPTNSKGIQHIVEHTVLCGSKKYPAKDPFVELAKGSLNTFLNAMTYSDKTVYPIASCNDKDFHNLMDVYLDAVFNPNIYAREEIFKQEGWHYEMADKDSDLIINGVVYNEMRGVYSSPDNVLAASINEKMYPDTPYGVDSGGNPDIIPDLSREEYLDYHKNYYHPSNSYVYLYGDMDIVETLKYIDEDYLSDYDYLYVPSEIPLQASFDKELKTVCKYSITEEEAEDSKPMVSYNVVTGVTTDKYMSKALDILQYILVDCPGAPLKQTIVDSGICSSVESQFDNTMQQPLFTLLGRDIESGDIDKFEEIIETELRHYVDEGIDKEALEAALNINEFKNKEGVGGRYPKGLLLGLHDFSGWLYDDELAQDTLTMQPVYDYLREGINKNYINPEDTTKGYFEALIEELLLNNNHKSVIVAEPEVGLNAEKDRALAEKLAEYKAGLSDEEIVSIVEETAHLKQYQTEPSTDEELATIPLLSIEDISKDIKKFFNRETAVAGIKTVAHDIFTNGITYLDIYFDLNDATYEDLPKISFISDLLTYVDTDKYTYNELSKKIDLKTGGLGIHPFDFIRLGDSSFTCMGVKVKTFDDKISDGIELIKEIIAHSHITDRKRIREVAAEINSTSKLSMLESGHLTARGRALSYIDRHTKIMDSFDGLDYYRFIDNLDKNFDSVIDELIPELDRLYKSIFRKEGMLISYTSDKPESVLEEPVSQLLEVLSDEKLSDEKLEVPLEIKNEGFKTASKVQYDSVAVNFVEAGLKYDGSLNVLKTILSYDYLWINVRVKGGAYGCMCDFPMSGNSFFVSYRDPNLRETYDIYRKAAEYVESFDCSDRDMVKYIIGTMSSVDAPMTPSQLGAASFGTYIAHITDEIRQDNRNNVLATTQEKIRSLAPYIRLLSESNVVCTVGSEEKVMEAADLFKTIDKLI